MKIFTEAEQAAIINEYTKELNKIVEKTKMNFRELNEQLEQYIAMNEISDDLKDKA